MFAMIEIPHQTPAKLAIYETDDEIINVAYELDARRGEDHEIRTREDAIEVLVSDLHGHLLVDDADDLQRVRRYTGHQRLRIASMADDIAEALGLATTAGKEE